MRQPIKVLIFLTLAVSLIAAVFPQLQGWLALTLSGFSHFYVWQLITYPFVELTPVSLSWFFQLGFNAYMLWIFGASLLERAGTVRFLALYFGSALVAGLTSLLFPHGILAGSTYPIYALFIAWLILNPQAQFLFFSFPFKAKWLLLGLIGLTLFTDITTGHLEQAAALVASLLFSYFFTLIAWRTQSFFSFLHPLERRILSFWEKKPSASSGHSKIYDIKSGAPVLSDEQFMDAMLDRISRHGENSLTPEEKKRMQQISQKKK